MSKNGFEVRIQLVREDSNLSQVDFGKKLGVSRHTIMKYESGRTEPELGFIIKTCSTFAVNSDWLIFGNPPKYIEGKNIPTKESAAELLERLLNAAKNCDPIQQEISSHWINDTDEITANTAENYINLFRSMKDNDRLRKRIFMYHFMENNIC